MPSATNRTPLAGWRLVILSVAASEGAHCRLARAGRSLAPGGACLRTFCP
eukprot:GSA120T00018203001.1